jgi:hypothetical protein
MTPPPPRVPVLSSDGGAACSRSLDPTPFDLQPVIGSQSLSLLQAPPPISSLQSPNPQNHSDLFLPGLCQSHPILQKSLYYNRLVWNISSAAKQQQQQQQQQHPRSISPQTFLLWLRIARAVPSDPRLRTAQQQQVSRTVHAMLVVLLMLILMLMLMLMLMMMVMVMVIALIVLFAALWDSRRRRGSSAASETMWLVADSKMVMIMVMLMIMVMMMAMLWWNLSAATSTFAPCNLTSSSCTMSAMAGCNQKHVCLYSSLPRHILTHCCHRHLHHHHHRHHHHHHHHHYCMRYHRRRCLHFVLMLKSLVSSTPRVSRQKLLIVRWETMGS